MVKHLNDVVVKIQKGPRTKPKVVHINRLKLHTGDSSLDWFSTTSETLDDVQQPPNGPLLEEASTDYTCTPPPMTAAQESLMAHQRQELSHGLDDPPLRRSNRTKNPPLRYAN